MVRDPACFQRVSYLSKYPITFSRSSFRCSRFPFQRFPYLFKGFLTLFKHFLTFSRNSQFIQKVSYFFQGFLGNASIVVSVFATVFCNARGANSLHSGNFSVQDSQLWCTFEGFPHTFIVFSCHACRCLDLLFEIVVFQTNLL